MPNDPKITVLMPAYNAGKYIGEAIKSVLQQSFTDFELLIVNDGSTDNTLAVIQSFDDPRIVVIDQENKGVSTAANIGMAAARAPYIARFDADDICYPHRLKTQYEFISTYPEYSIMGSAADYMDADCNFVFTYQPPAHLNEEIQQLKYTVCPFINSTMFFKKDSILKHGGFSEHAHSFEDHFLWVNILKNEKACNLSQPLIQVRLNPESLTIDERWQTRRFRDIKYSALKRCSITATEGAMLKENIRRHHTPQIKQGAYYALLGKKFLWDNYQPEKARENLKSALVQNRLDIKSYVLFLISFLPGGILSRLYNVIK